VSRLRGRIDFLLDLHLRKGLSSLSPLVLDLLRLGGYQLLYMDSVPAYAGISQTVEQVREVTGQGGGRLASGVLKSLEAEGGEVDRFPAFESDALTHLTTWGSHPAWMVARWLDRWGSREVQELVRLNNTPPELFFRPLGLSPSEAMDLLHKAGRDAKGLPHGVPCLQVQGGTNPADLLRDFRGIVQDPGAALVTEYADPSGASWVADLCAAPGGKALAMAGTGAYVLAADASAARARVLRENSERVEGGLGVVIARVQRPPLREAPFVLLDVPCTGTGTLRRHPDARWRLEPRSLDRMANLQAEMLDSCATLVSPGGHLVYSTCSLEPEENERQIDAFMSRSPVFELEETNSVDPRFLDQEKRLQVLPQRTGFDGAFCARMRRRA
jgi:16S rRNA (cytosine967-C5)-methyltransferase